MIKSSLGRGLISSRNTSRILMYLSIAWQGFPEAEPWW